MTKENPIDVATEAIRSLRNSLHFAMLEAKNNVVMISGASPTVGKSFVSSYLAIVLAQAGQKVLLIDADMRKGYILKFFDQKVENGLSELLIGNINLNDAIKDSGIDNLSLVTRGSFSPNPSELLMGQRFTQFIQDASKEFDLVIIDTLTVLTVTDASIIGHHPDTSLMLARFNHPSLKEIAEAANLF